MTMSMSSVNISKKIKLPSVNITLDEGDMPHLYWAIDT